MFEIGVSKKDITCTKLDVGMFGYGMHAHKVRGVESNLHARAFVISETGGNKKIAYVVCEILSCTIAVGKGVMKKLDRHHKDLGYFPENVMIVGTHTHCAPGGYSHYGVYNLSVSGFVPEVYTTIVDGVVEAIVEADANRKPGKISFKQGRFNLDTKVAFNRSLNAYNRNPEVEKLGKNDHHLAVDRQMSLLRMDEVDGKAIGTVNWFGVHPTSVGNDRLKICADNKGYAADFMEKDNGSSTDNKSFVSAFAQAPSGDVSPNSIWNKSRMKMCGEFEDDYESAKHNGRMQSNKAQEIYNAASGETPLDSTIDYGIVYNDFTNITPHPDFTDGKKDAKTGTACLGVAFFEGTTDGMGAPALVCTVARGLTNIVQAFEYTKAFFGSKPALKKIDDKYRTQTKKHILIETAERRVLGTPYIDALILPGWVDKTIKTFKKHYKNGSLAEKPWAPNVLPLQIIILGNLAIVGVPAEPTTVAGWRLKKTALDVLKERGVEEVIISPYANGYSGYITTREEYRVQRYEGGHTMYGEWTLAAYQTKLRELAQQMLKPAEERNLENSATPVEFTREDLKNRVFIGSNMEFNF